jgi:type I restriction enzyme S subunit
MRTEQNQRSADIPVRVAQSNETSESGQECPHSVAGDGNSFKRDYGKNWDMSEWKTTTVGEIATGFLSGGTPTTKRSDYWEGEIPWITSKWLGKKLKLSTGEKFVSEEAVKKTSTRIVPKDSIIFATRVGVGKVGINQIDLAINQDLAGILIDNEKYDIKFLAYQLCIDPIQQYVAMNKRGATIKGITRDCLEQIQLNLPPLPEQKKIAHILLTVQRAIEAQERIIQTTKELKKALMHKLFTEGLNGEPQKQTEIGPVPESWEVVKLETVFECFDGRRKAVKKSDRFPGPYPYYGASGIVDYVEDYLFDGDYLLLAEDGENLDSRKLPIAFIASGKFWVNNHAHILRAKRGNMWFYEQYIANMPIKDYLSGTTRPKLTKGHMMKMRLPFPPVEQQDEAAVALSNCDAKINTSEQKRRVLQDLFRTLLHELMTGKTRVKCIELSPGES